MDIERDIFDSAEDALPDEIASATTEDISRRAKLLENEIRSFEVSICMYMCF